jgi:hypothetical protein
MRRMGVGGGGALSGGREGKREGRGRDWQPRKRAARAGANGDGMFACSVPQGVFGIWVSSFGADWWIYRGSYSSSCAAALLRCYKADGERYGVRLGTAR